MLRKKWSKPKLLVLVRGKPEEMVLAGCKVWHGPVAYGTLVVNCVSTGGASAYWNGSS